MAGVGLDAFMIKAADSGLKDKVGRVAYVWTGAKALRRGRMKATVKVDGSVTFKGKTACVLVGNIQKVLGGITFFDQAQPDDGVLDVGIITAKSSGRVGPDAEPGGRGQGREVALRPGVDRQEDLGDPDASDAVRARRRRPTEDQEAPLRRSPVVDHRLRPDRAPQTSGVSS